METVAKIVSIGRPATLHTAANVSSVTGLFMANRRIAFNAIQGEIWLAQGILQTIVYGDLEMINVCALWMPRALMTCSCPTLSPSY